MWFARLLFYYEVFFNVYFRNRAQSFVSAHFLSGYKKDKCSNLHGHRWSVVARIAMDRNKLKKASPEIWFIDFGDFKNASL